MRIAIVGSRYFGAAAFEALQSDGTDIAQVVVPAADDRLAQAAQKAGVSVHVLADPKIVPGDAIPEGVDPMDARYNVVQWENRNERGWSIGSAITDPRTGEIIKGMARLDSHWTSTRPT